MFIAALFMKANKWKQSLSVKGRMDKQPCIFKRNQTIDMLNNMNESHKLYAE